VQQGNGSTAWSIEDVDRELDIAGSMADDESPGPGDGWLDVEYGRDSTELNDVLRLEEDVHG
jgi:hypothetical protein